jgi:lipoteichoic acid synthase
MDAMGLSEISWGAPDGSVFDFVKTLMRSQSAPFFYYIITMSSHEPFTLVKPYYHTDAFASAPGAARDYYTAMSYTDREIKSIVSDIRKARPDTYVFLYGDHTPLISRDFYKRATVVQDNRLFEFVPLFIITPDRRVYRENACVASFMDIAPTILNASGVAYRFKSSGANLLLGPLADGAISYRNGLYSRAELFRKISRAN